MIEEMASDRMIAGTRICSELKKPDLMPLHSAPVHSVFQALSQGSSVHSRGSEKISPSMICGMPLSDVTMIT